MTREEFEFMRTTRGSIRTVRVSADTVTELVGSSSNRLALLLLPASTDYVVGTEPMLSEQFTVRANGGPIELLLERVGDLVQRPLWVLYGIDGAISFVETVVGLFVRISVDRILVFFGREE
jgi:hypothetical protein